jgi:predicted GIY-YIG superfamily endonuclease
MEKSGRLVLMLHYFSTNWCSLNWATWIRLKTKREARRIIPNSQGVYRVRPKGKDFLVYVGQTNQLKRRTGMLALNSYKQEMPWNDPHPAAPNLWVWRQEQGWDYEVSVAATPALTRQNREGLECLLLCKYRLERGESTLCNHGRFHPNYIKSSNKLKGQRGRKLDPSEPRNPAGGPSCPPLRPLNTHTSSDWMGLSWTEVEKLKTASLLPANPGVYKLVDLAKQELLYVGETDNLRSRLNQHKRKFLEAAFSYANLSPEMLHYERLEIENDLIGYHYYMTGKSPICQFRKEKSYRSS